MPFVCAWFPMVNKLSGVVVPMPTLPSERIVILLSLIVASSRPKLGSESKQKSNWDAAAFPPPLILFDVAKIPIFFFLPTVW